MDGHLLVAPFYLGILFEKRFALFLLLKAVCVRFVLADKHTAGTVKIFVHVAAECKRSFNYFPQIKHAGWAGKAAAAACGRE